MFFFFKLYCLSYTKSFTPLNNICLFLFYITGKWPGCKKAIDCPKNFCIRPLKAKCMMFTCFCVRWSFSLVLKVWHCNVRGQNLFHVVKKNYFMLLMMKVIKVVTILINYILLLSLQIYLHVIMLLLLKFVYTLICRLRELMNK